LDRCQDEGVKEWAAIKANVRDALGRYLFEKTRRRPMILPIIQEV
jgi:ribonuclease J